MSKAVVDLMDEEFREEATDTDQYIMGGRQKEQDRAGKRKNKPRTEGKMTKLRKIKKETK